MLSVVKLVKNKTVEPLADQLHGKRNSDFCYTINVRPTSHYLKTCQNTQRHRVKTRVNMVLLHVGGIWSIYATIESPNYHLDR